MTELRRELHAVAAVPLDDLDPATLVARIARRRRRRALAASTAAVVVMLGGVGGALGARGGSGDGTLRTRDTGSVTTRTTGESTTTAASTTVAPSTSASPTTRPSGNVPWHASPATGLANYDPVTITATGVPDGSYDVGQCPASVSTPDIARCSLDAIVTATNGNLTATVHALWWLGSQPVDCGAAPGTCVVGFAATSPQSTYAPVSIPISFDPNKRPTATVTPTTSLVDGDKVEVRGFHIGAGKVSVRECLAEQSGACATYVEAPIAADGSFVMTTSVARVITWGFHGLLDNTTVCSVDAECALFIDWLAPGEGGSRVQIVAPVGIHFDLSVPPPTTTTSTSTTTPG